MIKMMAAACRRPGMTHAEYANYARRVHGVMARVEPVKLARYVQNHVFDSAFGSLAEASHKLVPSIDSVTELFWDDRPSMRDTFMHPYTRETMGPDAENFIDQHKTQSLITVEEPMPVPNAGPSDAKVMHFLRKHASISLETFFERWTAAHQYLVDHAPTVVAPLRKAVQSRQFAEANSLLAYFGNPDVKPYEGVASLWYEDTLNVGQFRQYEKALQAYNAKPGQEFYAPDESFFLYVEEVTILYGKGD